MNSIQIILVDKGNGKNEIRIALYYIIVHFFFFLQIQNFYIPFFTMALQ